MNPSSSTLNFPAGVGQRTSTFRFALHEARSGAYRGDITPLQAPAPTINHAAGTVIKRSMSMMLETSQSEKVDQQRDQIRPFMLVDGREFSLGRFRFTSGTPQIYKNQELVAYTLADDMLIVDTELETAFNVSQEPAIDAIRRLIEGTGIPLRIEDSQLEITNSWAAGTTRLNVLGTLAAFGGYLAPWIDAEGTMQCIREFDPAAQPPDFDFDSPGRIIRESIVTTDNIGFAYNRIVVVANGAGTIGT